MKVLRVVGGRDALVEGAPTELRLGARAEGDDQLPVVRAPPRRRLFHGLRVELCDVLLEITVVLLQLGGALRECPGVIRRLLPRENNRLDERGHLPSVKRLVEPWLVRCRLRRQKKLHRGVRKPTGHHGG